MKIETRKFGKTKHLLLILESDEESNLVDDILGDCVKHGVDGVLGITGSIQLAGYGEHYICLTGIHNERSDV